MRVYNCTPSKDKRPYSTANMNIFLCDMHVTFIGKASPLMRYTNMSDSFKQLDTRGGYRNSKRGGSDMNN